MGRGHFDAPLAEAQLNAIPDGDNDETEKIAAQMDELVLALLFGTTTRTEDADGRPIIEAPNSGVLVTRGADGIEVQLTSRETDD